MYFMLPSDQLHFGQWGMQEAQTVLFIWSPFHSEGSWVGAWTHISCDPSYPPKRSGITSFCCTSFRSVLHLRRLANLPDAFQLWETSVWVDSLSLTSTHVHPSKIQRRTLKMLNPQRRPSGANSMPAFHALYIAVIHTLDVLEMLSLWAPLVWWDLSEHLRINQSWKSFHSVSLRSSLGPWRPCWLSPFDYVRKSHCIHRSGTQLIWNQCLFLLPFPLILSVAGILAEDTIKMLLSKYLKHICSIFICIISIYIPPAALAA